MKLHKTFCLLYIALLSGPSTAGPQNLRELIQVFHNESPQKKADASSVESILAQQEAANSLPAPELSFELGNRAVSPGMSNETMFIGGVILGQEIMWPGKRNSMQRSEFERSKMAQENFNAQLRKSEYLIAQYYLEIHMTQQRQLVIDSTLHVMSTILESAQRRFETGMGSLEDLFRIKAEIAKLHTDSLDLVGEANAMKAMLSASVGVATMVEIHPNINILDSARELPSVDSLVNLALNRPEIRSMQAEKRMSAYDEEYASFLKMPDIMLQGKYMTMMGPDEWSIMAGVKIPLAPWSSSDYKSKINVAKSRQQESELRIQAMRIMLAQQVKEAHLRYQNSLLKLEQIKTERVTTAENALRAAQVSYGSGKTDLTMSLDALRMTLMTWDDFIMAHLQVIQSILYMERSAGVSPGTWIQETYANQGAD